ncbi:MAG: hypothetical protein ACJAS4_000064 [Bacteriovoracaceae bacterium]|jgi:hypothetical protein
MIKFFNYLIYSNIFISLCACALYFLFELKGNYNFTISSVLLVFTGTYIGYHLLRYIPYKKGLFVENEFITFYETYPVSNSISFLLALITLTLTALDLSLHNFLILGICFLLVLSYEKVLFSKFDFRSVPYLKSFFISLVWTLVATCLNGLPEIIDFLDCYIFILLLCIPFDLKDLESDKAQGIRTLPTILKEKTPYIISALFILYSIYFYHLTSERFFIFAPFLFSIFIFLKERRPFLFYLGLDGIIIIRLLFYLNQN